MKSPKFIRSDNGITVVFRETSGITDRIEFSAVIDLDEFSDPTGLEISDAKRKLGLAAIADLRSELAGREVRFSYDDESDIALFGLAIGHGTRYLRSVPHKVSLTRDGRGLVVSLAFEGSLESD